MSQLLFGLTTKRVKAVSYLDSGAILSLFVLQRFLIIFTATKGGTPPLTAFIRKMKSSLRTKIYLVLMSGLFLKLLSETCGARGARDRDCQNLQRRLEWLREMFQKGEQECGTQLARCISKVVQRISAVFMLQEHH